MESIPWPGGDWQATARLFGALIGGYLLVLWFASILWVYRDIQSRSQDPITQAIGVGIAVVFLWLLPTHLERSRILGELHRLRSLRQRL